MQPGSKAAPVHLLASGDSLPWNSPERQHLSGPPMGHLRNGHGWTAGQHTVCLPILLHRAMRVSFWSQPTSIPSFYPRSVGEYLTYLDVGTMSIPDTIMIDACEDTLVVGEEWIMLIAMTLAIVVAGLGCIGAGIVLGQ